MENIYQWDRDDKLFAIQGLKASSSAERGDYLLQLVIDDDPVVRGKAALALQDCGDDVLLEAADALLDQNEDETTILACEILGFTENVDFSDRVESLLESGDDRVVRSVIEILDELPENRTLELLQAVVRNYEEAWSKAIFRLLNRLRSSKLSTLLEELFATVEDENRVTVLRVAARIADEDDREWFDQLRSEVSLNDEKEAFLEWLVQS
jgi:hypothetical protein